MKDAPYVIFCRIHNKYIKINTVIINIARSVFRINIYQIKIL